jgi:2',3'-cyclic-nucleotide 2'-phosphodiesterase/3'-nucleotidase
LPLVDGTLGLVAGVPSVMASCWGQHLGVIKLGLKFDGSRWTVDPGRTAVEARPIATTCMNGTPQACQTGESWITGAACSFATRCSDQIDGTPIQVASDPELAALIGSPHADAIAHAKLPLGISDFEMATSARFRSSTRREPTTSPSTSSRCYRSTPNCR